MDETYDYVRLLRTPLNVEAELLQLSQIILGTGLTECVLSGLLSVDGAKVLHMDRCVAHSL